MKIQDILFVITILGMLFYKVKPSIFAVIGIICIITAVPLFSFWVFFTAQRFVYYAAGFIFIGSFLLLLKRSK